MEGGAVVGSFDANEEHYSTVEDLPNENVTVLFSVPQNVTGFKSLMFEFEMDLMDMITLFITIVEKVVIICLFIQVHVKRKTIKILTSKIRGLERDVARSEYVISVFEHNNSVV